MTGAQAFFLKTQSKQAEDPDPFDETIGKVEALRRIDALKVEAGLTAWASGSGERGARAQC